MTIIAENHVEDACLSRLECLCYTVVHGPKIFSDGNALPRPHDLLPPKLMSDEIRLKDAEKAVEAVA